MSGVYFRRGGKILNMPRVRGETFLFDPQRLLTGDQLQDEKWNLRTLSPAIASKYDCIVWCAERRLLKNSTTCNYCQQHCRTGSAERSFRKRFALDSRVLRCLKQWITRETFQSNIEFDTTQTNFSSFHDMKTLNFIINS